MADRYFTHIVGCLEASIKTAEDGVDCRISAVTVQGAVDLLKEQQERIERLQQIWIPVSERPPEDGSDILVYCDDGEESRIVACNYANGVWFDCVFNTVMVFKNITHWMPLPKPPKKDGDGE